MSINHHSPTDQKLNTNEFFVVLDYKREELSAQGVLEISTSFLDALEKLDSGLLGSYSKIVDHWYVLEGLSKSSIRMKIVQCLKLMDDEALRNLDITKMLGALLVRGKYYLLHLIMKHHDDPIQPELVTFAEKLPELADVTLNPQLENLTHEPEELAEIVRKFLETLETLRDEKGIESIKYECVKEGKHLSTTIQINQISMDHMFRQSDGPSM